jgi:hypothetical protein
VSDSTGKKLAYIYFEDDPGRRAAAKLLTKDEANRIAVNIAKLPDFCADNEKIADVASDYRWNRASKQFDEAPLERGAR